MRLNSIVRHENNPRRWISSYCTLLRHQSRISTGRFWAYSQIRHMVPDGAVKPAMLPVWYAIHNDDAKCWRLSRLRDHARGEEASNYSSRWVSLYADQRTCVEIWMTSKRRSLSDST